MEGSKHILIVDDDAEFAGMVAEAVRDVSDAYVVQVSTDAKAAIAEILAAQTSARTYDLVITDIKMPGSSGLQLLRTLAEIAPATKTITMTAYHSPELASQAQQLHVHAYLIKPIALSEFRQVVHSALSGPQDYVETPPLPSQLLAAQKAAVERRLANLRATTNSLAALLIHTNGTLLAIDSLEAGLDASALCEALIDAQRSIAQVMRRTLSTDAAIQQSYYGTETYSICIYRLDESYVIATIFGPTVREGQVWYYLREASTHLAAALVSKGESATSPRPDVGDDWRTKIEQFFAETITGRTRKRRTADVNDTGATGQESAAVPSAEQPAATPRTDTSRDHTLTEAKPVQPSLEQIDWDIPTDQNWDQLVTDASGTFEGIGLEEAQNRGLYTPQPSDRSASEGTERPSVHDIDWEVSTDLDWDGLVADTDQGFAGMDFEEAKRQGLIDNLESDQVSP